MPAPQRETTRSPHGPLAIPCENCHTATGWRPIRAVPEFDHNKTRYPLRGMHEKELCPICRRLREGDIAKSALRLGNTAPLAEGFANLKRAPWDTSAASCEP